LVRITTERLRKRHNDPVISVRALTDADWAAVLRIYAGGIATGDATFETDVPRREVLDARWLPGHRWVADLAGAVVGWAAASPVSTRSYYAGVAETAVYAADGFHGRGVGRALMQHLVAAADEAGLWTLQTSVFPENIATLELHYAAGFRVVGVRERIAQHQGRWRDLVLIERRRAE
jgi:L-amino acid N-acyltransferase YncA